METITGTFMGRRLGVQGAGFQTFPGENMVSASAGCRLQVQEGRVGT